MQRFIICLDMDSFYASIEERDDPTLRGTAIAVCMFSGRTKTSGAVATANYKARELGIKSGMAIALAKKKAGDEEVHFLPVRKEYYEKVSDEIMDLLETETDVLEKRSIDEAYLDVSKRCNDYGEAKALALRMKAEIAELEKLSCSVGIGPNKLVAKMAAGFEKPDGLTVVHPSEAKAFIHAFPLKKLHGVGPKALEKLEAEGVGSIVELEKLSEERLKKLFGPAKGVYFYHAARGEDDSPVEARREKEQIGRLASLKENSDELGDVMPVLRPLCKEVLRKLKKVGKDARTVTVSAVFENMSMRSKSKTVSEPISGKTLEPLAEQLMTNLISENERKIRRVGVSLSKLSDRHAQKTIGEFK